MKTRTCSRCSAVSMITALTILLLLGLSQAHAQTRVNVGHVAPFTSNLSASAVGIDVNSVRTLTGVQYNQFSGYLELSAAGVAPGATLLEVFAPPGGATAAISDTVTLAADTDYTVLAIGNGFNQMLSLLPLVDDNSVPTAGNAKLRIVHAAPFAANLADTAVSIRLDDGDLVNNLANVQYGQESGFFELPAATYDLQVASPNGATTFIDLAPVTLPAGAIVTVFAIGDASRQTLAATAFFSDGTVANLPLEVATNLPIPTISQWAMILLMLALAAVVFAQRDRLVRSAA